MSTIPFLTSVDLSKNELQNAAIQNLAANPSNPVVGQVYFNTVDQKLKIYTQTGSNPSTFAWEEVGSTITLTTETGSEISITPNQDNTYTFAIDLSSADGTLIEVVKNQDGTHTINHTAPDTVAQNTENTGNTVIQNLTFDDFGHVIGTEAVSVTLEGLGLDADNYASWTISDGTNETDVESGDTVSVEGADNGGISVTNDSGSITITNTDKGSDQLIFGTINDVRAANNTSSVEVVGEDGLSTAVEGDNESLRILLTNVDKGSAQSIFKNITIGQQTIAASSNDDSFEIEAGENITVSADTVSKKITIGSTDAGSDQNIFKNIRLNDITETASNNNDTYRMSFTSGLNVSYSTLDSVEIMEALLKRASTEGYEVVGVEALSEYISLFDGPTEERYPVVFLDDTVARRNRDNVFTGNNTFEKPVTFEQDVYFKGNTTVTNTETLNIADNLLVLNSDFDEGVPTEDSGILVARGDSSNVAIFWDESIDQFVVAYTNEDGSSGTVSYTTLADFSARDLDVNTITVNNTPSVSELTSVSFAVVGSDGQIRSISPADVATELGIDNSVTAATGSPISVTETTTTVGNNYELDIASATTTTEGVVQIATADNTKIGVSDNVPTVTNIVAGRNVVARIIGGTSGGNPILSFSIPHNLRTRNVIVQCYDEDSGANVMMSTLRIDDNEVVISTSAVSPLSVGQSVIVMITSLAGAVEI